MRIIDETSNAGRQIVPEDMNYLSLADREVVSAIEALMKRIAGVDDPCAIAVSGCAVSYEHHTMQNKSLYKISNGVILWDGLLWNLYGYELQGMVKDVAFYDSALSIVFDRTGVAKPSPVFGMDLQLDQEPHKEMIARVMLTEDAMNKSEESITLGMLMRMPKLGLGSRINATLNSIRFTATEIG